MKLIWHIARKDLFRLRYILLLWAAMITAWLGFARIQSRLDTGSAMGFIVPAWIFGLLFLPLFGYGLVMGVLADDSVCDADAFWITRPISGRQLLGAKLLVLGLLSLFPALVSIPWWMAQGYNVAQLAVASIDVTKWQLVIFVVAAPLAALAPSTAQFIASLLVTGCCYLALNSMHDRLVDPALPAYVNPSFVYCERLIFAVWLIATVAILLNQFQSRLTRRSQRIRLAAVILGFGLTACVALHPTRFVATQEEILAVPVSSTNRVLATVPALAGAGAAQNGQAMKIIDIVPNDPRGTVFTVSESAPDFSWGRMLSHMPARPAFRHETYFLVHRRDGRSVLGQATAVGQNLTAATIGYSRHEVVFSAPRAWNLDPVCGFKNWVADADLVKVGSDLEDAPTTPPQP